MSTVPGPDSLSPAEERYRTGTKASDQLNELAKPLLARRGLAEHSVPLSLSIVFRKRVGLLAI